MSSAVISLAAATLHAAGAARQNTVDLHEFRVIAKTSGPDNYYRVVEQPEPYIHASYRPPMKTTVLGFEMPEPRRRKIASIGWSWRALRLPRGGDECTPGKGDSAASVYVTWKRGFKWYSIKYVFSATGSKGRTCASKRNAFRAQDTVIVDSGAPLDEWRTVRIVPDTEFRGHFEGGDSTASVPDLVGIGIMTDGDQTGSESSADYANFVLVSK
jgi:hypothetical protein